MLNDTSKKRLEKLQISSQITLKKRQQSNYSHPVTTDISGWLPNIQTSSNTTERNEAVNEIEAMNNFLVFQKTFPSFILEFLNSYFHFKNDPKKKLNYPITTKLNNGLKRKSRVSEQKVEIKSSKLKNLKDLSSDLIPSNQNEGIIPYLKKQL